jgi:transcriptional regulator with XRE-family HTH domain
MRFAEALRTARLAKGWSQQQLADHIFVTQGAVSLWERGKNEPELAMLARIARALDAPHLSLDLTPTRAKVPIMGTVGRQQQITQIPDEPLREIEAPPDTPPDAVAFVLDEPGVLPNLPKGAALVIWDKRSDPTEVYGQLCVVMTADGQRLVKTVQRGTQRDRYRLTAYGEKDLVDIALRWAAPVERIDMKPKWVSP